ncbi:hypothetical protein [Klebsiella pneumoniae IS43]|uniref:Uncharacterized protein n=1 Tax=Klebsiella pneumoniae IS43 TaxID=1432552 RepID=W1DT86_KLEPN|nr:hypothetical protein [Klebsiella pneumoniae IS43]
MGEVQTHHIHAGFQHFWSASLQIRFSDRWCKQFWSFS